MLSSLPEIPSLSLNTKRFKNDHVVKCAVEELIHSSSTKVELDYVLIILYQPGGGTKGLYNGSSD